MLFNRKLSRHCAEKLVLVSCVVSVLLVLGCLATTFFLKVLLGVISLQSHFGCNNRPSDKLTFQHGEYWVLSNYVRAGLHRTIGCSGTATLTLQGDYTDIYKMEQMYNIKDPNAVATSFAVYVPDQFHLDRTLEAIVYVRNCVNFRVTNVVFFVVSFHIYFPLGSKLKFLPRLRSEASFDLSLRCSNLTGLSRDSNFENTALAKEPHYTKQKSIIVGRNIAQLMATTKYLLPLDGATYPSANLMPILIREISLVDICAAEAKTEEIMMRLPVVSVHHLQDKDHSARLSTQSVSNSLQRSPRFYLEVEDMRLLSDGSSTTSRYCPTIFSFENNLKLQMNYPSYFLGTWDIPLLEENNNISIVESETLRIYNLFQQGYQFMVPLGIFLLHNVSKDIEAVHPEASTVDPALIKQYNVMFRDPDAGNEYLNSQSA